jgi:hypothetical protein
LGDLLVLAGTSRLFLPSRVVCSSTTFADKRYVEGMDGQRKGALDRPDARGYPLWDWIFDDLHGPLKLYNR